MRGRWRLVCGKRSRISEWKCHDGEVCERRGTWESVRESATKTATNKGQRPRSGRSCIEHRAGFARLRARGSSRAAHEATACSAARVRPGPETPAVDVADPADGQKVGWIMNLERMGSPGGRVCKALCGLCSAFCSQSARRRLRTGRAHVLVWGTPRNARLACYVQGDVMAARMVGIRQEGNPCRMVPSEKGRGAQSTNSCHDVTEKERGM